LIPLIFAFCVTFQFFFAILFSLFSFYFFWLYVATLNLD
jgi:hypothetical protein